MLIVNADDWGRSVGETDAALACHVARRITSVTAMVCMRDSERAAGKALEHGLPVGLHLNLSEAFACPPAGSAIAVRQERVCRFIKRSRYAFLLYNPALRADFIATYQAQFDEFMRLYGKPPTHIDGHHHMHLCANLLFDRVIPAGLKVRRNFDFWPEEKGAINRAYRTLTDRRLARRYRITDYFFALSQCLKPGRMARVVALATTASVEVMTHPVNPNERSCLMSEPYGEQLEGLTTGSYASL